MAAATDGIFMCISSALGPESKSFEEVRIEEYIKFYTETGRPPPPVPQEPADETQRRALGLPPLFKPHNPPTTTSALTRTPTVLIDDNKPKITSPTDLPVGQEFSETSNAGERYQTISAMSQYEFFSVEELRVYAYMRGNKTAPVPITMTPFTLKETSGSSGVTSEDQLQSLAAQPAFSRHSPEELRIAFLLSGRELNSAEIIQLSSPWLPPPTPPSTLPIPTAAATTTTTTAFSTPAAAPASNLFAPSLSSTPSNTPKFTFGVR